MELQTGITRDIYPMPAFVTLEVSDVHRTVAWYESLGFVSLFTMPGPDGAPRLVHLRRWRYQDVLVRPGTPAPTGGQTLSLAGLAEELDAVAGRAREHSAGTGAGSVEGPLDTPWNTRDLRLTDPDGYVLVLTAQRPAADRDAAFEQHIRDLAAEQLGDSS
jgi:catechol 2,3-dioxygenase-like lactoylglutathione lyase family enzyme